MNDTTQDLTEAALILSTINKFIDGARHIETKDMTALTSALIESLVHTMSQNTDPDTALWCLTQIVMRLAPDCKRGSVQVIPQPSRTRQ